MLELDEGSGFYVDSVNHRPYVRVTDVLAEFGFIEARGEEEHLIRGTVVHECVRLIEKGTLDRESVDPIVEGRVRAYEHFKRERSFRATVSEEIVHDDVYRYAGRLDLFGLLGGQLALIDVKSGQVPKSAGLQTGGYEPGVRRLLNLGPIATIKRFGLALRDDESYSLVPFEDPSEPRVFQSLASAWWYRFNSGLVMRRKKTYA